MITFHPNTTKLSNFSNGNKPIASFLNLIFECNVENPTIAEVGTYTGATSVFAAQLVKQKKGTFLAIDTFDGSDNVSIDSPHSNKHLQKGEVLRKFKENIDSVECTEITKIYEMDSLKAANKIEDNSLDICFIDASHLYTDVKNDIIAYLPKVKKGGIICGHDFEMGSENVISDVTENQFKCDYVTVLVDYEINAETSFRGKILEKKVIDFKKIAFWLHPGVTRAVLEQFGSSYNIKTTLDNVWIVRL